MSAWHQQWLLLFVLLAILPPRRGGQIGSVEIGIVAKKEGTENMLADDGPHPSTCPSSSLLRRGLLCALMMKDGTIDLQAKQVACDKEQATREDCEWALRQVHKQPQQDHGSCACDLAYLACSQYNKPLRAEHRRLTWGKGGSFDDDGRERKAVLPNTTQCPMRVYVLDVPMGKGDRTPLHDDAESKGAKQEKGFGGGSGLCKWAKNWIHGPPSDGHNPNADFAPFLDESLRRSRCRVEEGKKNDADIIYVSYLPGWHNELAEQLYPPLATVQRFVGTWLLQNLQPHQAVLLQLTANPEPAQYTKLEGWLVHAWHENALKASKPFTPLWHRILRTGAWSCTLTLRLHRVSAPPAPQGFSCALLA